MTPDAPTGIAGLKGRPPIGAAVTIGIKGDKGFPTQRDRFHIVEVNENDQGRRPHHRAFDAFNSVDNPEARRLLRGNIVHATQAGCFESRLNCQVQPGGQQHPRRIPFCRGDGVTAVRWMGGDEGNFKSITCPHDKCEYRQPQQGNKPIPCKPWMRFAFRITWAPETQALLVAKGRPEMPSMTVKLTSGSWATAANFKGFFDSFCDNARELGVANPVLFGLPFVLQLTERTNRQRKSRYPVITITPTMDVVEFLMKQRDQLDHLHATPPAPALTDESEQAPTVVADDLDSISVPGC